MMPRCAKLAGWKSGDAFALDWESNYADGNNNARAHSFFAER